MAGSSPAMTLERKRSWVPDHRFAVSGMTPRLARSRRLRRLGREALRLFDRLLNGAHHVEGGLRQVVVLTLDQALEALDGVLQRDELAGRAGEHLGDEER